RFEPTQAIIDVIHFTEDHLRIRLVDAALRIQTRVDIALEISEAGIIDENSDQHGKSRHSHREDCLSGVRHTSIVAPAGGAAAAREEVSYAFTGLSVDFHVFGSK